MVTFVMACIFTVASSSLLDGVNWGMGMLIVVILICIGTAIVSALTIGGKAMGKSYAIYCSTSNIPFMGQIFYKVEKRFGIRIFGPKRKSKSSNGKRGENHARNNQST